MSSKTKFPGIRARGNSIQVDFRYKGIRCRETLKIKPTASNLKIAASKLGAINLDITLGKFVYSAYFPQSKKVKVFGHKQISNMTVAEGLDWWWDNYKPKIESTAKKHETIIRKHIKPSIGEIILRDLKASQIKNWINSVELSISSKNGILTPLRSMFTEAYSEELVDENIMDRITNETRNKKNKNPLSVDEVDRVLNFLRNNSLEAENYYKFAIWTGLATGEQLGLKWGDVDFNEYKISISRMLTCNKLTDTKNSFRTRKIELLSPAFDALEKLKPNDFDINSKKYINEYIFKNPNTEKVWTSGVIAKHWNKALKTLNLKARRSYESRHTFASIMVTACIPYAWIKTQMGHATMKMLEEVYGKWLGDADKVINWVLKNTQDGKNGADFTKLFLDLYKK